jgi:hypothetical protein
MKIRSRLRRNVIEADAAHLGKYLCSFHHERRLVAFAAMRWRRKIGRIRLDEQPFGWQIPGDGADFVGVSECKYAGERDVAAKFDTYLGEPAP